MWGGRYRPHHEYVVFETLIKDLRAKLSKSELRECGLAPILEIASAVLLGMKPPLPKPSSRHDYVYVVRVSREVTGLYAANGVEVRAPNMTEARRIVEDMDAQFKLQMKFEKAVNRQPLTVVFTDRRPAEDKQEATQGETPMTNTHGRPLDTRPQYTQSTVAFEIRLTLASLELLTAAQKVLAYWNGSDPFATSAQADSKYDTLQSAVNEYRAAFTNLPKGMSDYPLNAGENK